MNSVPGRCKDLTVCTRDRQSSDESTKTVAPSTYAIRTCTGRVDASHEGGLCSFEATVQKGDQMFEPPSVLARQHSNIAHSPLPSHDPQTHLRCDAIVAEDNGHMRRLRSLKPALR